jgi:Flp pilus assembly protein TadB
MDIESKIQDLLVVMQGNIQDNILVSVVIGLFIIFLLFRHPKILLVVLLFLMAAYGLAWLFERLAQYGLG